MTQPFTQPELTLLQRMNIIQTQEFRDVSTRAANLMREAYRKQGIEPNDPSTWANSGTPILGDSQTTDTSTTDKDNVPGNDPANSGVYDPATDTYTEKTSTAGVVDDAISSISNLISGSFGRGVVVVLGFIFVAVGLVMFGKGTTIQVTGLKG